MSHFYGKLQGNKGEATRCGTRNSGLLAAANGRDIGGVVRAIEHDNQDVMWFTLTGGSKGGSRQWSVAEITQADLCNLTAGTHRLVPARIEPIVVVPLHEDEGG